MTPEQIEAERKRFEATFKHLMDFSRGDDGEYRSNPTHAGFAGWQIRAEIAIAERAELLAENERLRERVKELSRDNLESILRDLRTGPDAVSATEAWGLRDSGLNRLAEEAGVWFDDDGNEWSLDKWRERMGGAG